MQHPQPEPMPRQFNDGALEDGIIGGMLNLEMDPPVPDEPL